MGEKTWVQRVAMMRPGSRGTEPGRRVGCPGQFKDRSHQQSVLRDSLKSCERSRPGLLLQKRGGQLPRHACCVRRCIGVPALRETETWRLVHVVHRLLVRASFCLSRTSSWHVGRECSKSGASLSTKAGHEGMIQQSRPRTRSRMLRFFTSL